ncbi:MAG: NADH-quinone oxidoreductase subunit M [Isosphaeraceae bacterium]
MVTAVCASWESVKERTTPHYSLMLALHTGLLGLFASLDVVLFYVFFEFTLIPLFFLIGLFGGPERKRASITFFLYTLAGSLLTLLGVIALVVVNARHAVDPLGDTLTFSMPKLAQSLSAISESWPEWSRADSLLSPQVLIFLLLFAGFAIKVPLFPFHTWLPLAHVEAPTAGSILLAGVLLKVGAYGLLRFNISMTPLGAKYLFPMLATIAVAGIIYGALAALAQSDVKKLVAYSSVSHMGFIVLGMFAMNSTGLEGSVVQMINHGVTTGALFACVGVIYERYHTREMSKMSGLWERFPLFAFFFILAALGSAAVPGLNGFIGEFPCIAGMFARSKPAAVVACLGMILGAYYLLWMLQRVLFGPLKEPTEHGEDHHDGHAGSLQDSHAKAAPVRPMAWHEILGLTPLMVLIVFMGVYPKPMLNNIHAPVALLRHQIEKAEAANVRSTVASTKPKHSEQRNSRATKVTMSRRPSPPIQDVSR